MKLIAAIVATLVLIAGIVLFVTSRSRVEEAPVPVAAAPAAGPEPAAPAPVPEPAPPAAEPARPARKATPRRAEPSTVPAEPAAPTLATLVLESDVPGASAFVDRQYVGTTPLRLDQLEPGTRQVKLTADGYEGIERSVDLSPGDNPVTMRFREVRLNKRMDVTHKHAMGSCPGTLVATVDGIAYETTNKNDAFNLAYAQIETFTIDYMDKNLRVKQKGGKTWNFTDKTAANADALFVFHRDVEAARKKLAEGYTAVR